MLNDTQYKQKYYFSTATIYSSSSMKCYVICSFNIYEVLHAKLLSPAFFTDPSVQQLS